MLTPYIPVIPAPPEKEEGPALRLPTLAAVAHLHPTTPTKLSDHSTEQIKRMIGVEMARIRKGYWYADPARAWALQMELDARGKG